LRVHSQTEFTGGIEKKGVTQEESTPHAPDGHTVLYQNKKYYALPAYLASRRSRLPQFHGRKHAG
jgi:hypothetical protein